MHQVYHVPLFKHYGLSRLL